MGSSFNSKEFDLVSDDYWQIAPFNTSGGAYSAGEAVKENEVSGFTLADIPDTEKYTLVVKASRVRAAKAAVTIVAGEVLYWDDGNSVVTNVDPGGTIVLGYAIEGAASGDATVLMTFDGRGIAIN